MVENELYCVDIATQVNAAIWLLKSVNNKLLENHLKCCWPKFLNTKDPIKLDNFIKELIRARNVTTRK
jgi:DNA-binding FrmR family transcriptional regulator